MKKIQKKDLWLLMAHMGLLSLILLSPGLVSYITTGDPGVVWESLWISCFWLAPTVGIYLFNFYLIIPLAWMPRRYWLYGSVNALLVASRPSLSSRIRVFSSASGWISKASTCPLSTRRQRNAVSCPLPIVASIQISPSRTCRRIISAQISSASLYLLEYNLYSDPALLIFRPVKYIIPFLKVNLRGLPAHLYLLLFLLFSLHCISKFYMR